MPSGPKKRRAARRKERGEKNLAFKSEEKSEDQSKQKENASEPEPSLSGNDEPILSLAPEERMIPTKMKGPISKIGDELAEDVAVFIVLEDLYDSAEDSAVYVAFEATQNDLDESARRSRVFESPSDHGKESVNYTATMTLNTVDSNPNGTDEKSIDAPEIDVVTAEDASASAPPINVEVTQENPNESARGSSTDVQFDHIMKTLEEALLEHEKLGGMLKMTLEAALLANEKMGGTLEKLWNELESVKNNSDLSSSS